MQKLRTLAILAATQRRARLCLVPLVALSLAYGIAAPAAHAQWPWRGWFDEEPVGSPQWWKKHRKHATFDPEKGYQVEGVDGYFDGDGRPIQGPVAVERVVEAGEDHEEVGLIPGLDPRVQYNKMKAAVGLGPNEQFARAAYAEGERLFIASE